MPSMVNSMMDPFFANVSLRSSPELMRTRILTFESDIWAMGVFIMIIVTKKLFLRLLFGNCSQTEGDHMMDYMVMK